MVNETQLLPLLLPTRCWTPREDQDFHQTPRRGLLTLELTQGVPRATPNISNMCFLDFHSIKAALLRGSLLGVLQPRFLV